MPAVSVVMPVYNASQFFSEAVESILAQSFKDFELIIIDDASQDGSPDIVKSYKDPRIVFVQNHKNVGVAQSLNKGLDLAKGYYIARMDADDISEPGRLEQQVRFMEKHPDVGISGGFVHLFGKGMNSIARVPADSEDILAYMIFENPMWHMSVIMRKDMLQKYHLYYDPTFSRSEDYDLWARASQHFPMANLGDVLVRVRVHEASATRANWDEMTIQTEAIQDRLLERWGYHVSDEEKTFHHRVGRGYRMNSRKDIERAEAWLQKMCDTNARTKNINDISFRRIAAVVWFRLCANSGPLGPWIFKKWHSSSLASRHSQPLSEVVRFVTSITWHSLRRRIVA